MQFLDSLLSAEADGREYGVHRGEQERRDDDGREAEYFGMKNSAISVSRRRRMSLAYVRRVRKIKSDSRSCIAFITPDMQKNVERNVMPPAHKRAVEISVLLVMRCRFLYNNG